MTRFDSSLWSKPPSELSFPVLSSTLTFMREGLYVVRFETNLNDGGAGVALLEKGKFQGGDSAFYWTGKYRIEDGEAVIEVRTQRHTDGIPSALGLADTLDLELRGTFSSDGFDVKGLAIGSTERIAVKGFRTAQ